MVKIRRYVVIIFLGCFGMIGFLSNMSYAIWDCTQQDQMINDLTKQALLYKDRLNTCQQENAKLQQEKEALSKELDQTRKELEDSKEKLRGTHTNFQFSIVGIGLAAGLGLFVGVFLTVKTKNDARQRNS
ncbi:hypothetical protein U14_02121 [Candidatus Moduliflexus flocculans]|uniref:Uncharacterized protein n=1 Tax=Candidatus Moduliflexus flocculans TaxID=1499966 RepID=A0A0S6VTU8_9BACT|nr:hypothetical protein U14_02121 [Candidatus Moduliflexus flocculans]